MCLKETSITIRKIVRDIKTKKKQIQTNVIFRQSYIPLTYTKFKQHQ